MTNGNDELLEIKNEYKTKKKQLEKYDTFLDNHQGLVVFLPLLLVCVGILVLVGITSGTTQPGYTVLAKVVGVISLILFIGAIVMAFVTGIRKSAKEKIEKQLSALKDEAIVFQNSTKREKAISNDELGLLQDIKSKDTPHSGGGWVLGVIVIVVVASFITINQANQRSQQEAARQAERVLQQKQQQEAQDRYDQQQKDAQESYERSKIKQCVSTGVGSSVYTNCY